MRLLLALAFAPFLLSPTAASAQFKWDEEQQDAVDYSALAVAAGVAGVIGYGVYEICCSPQPDTFSPPPTGNGTPDPVDLVDQPEATP